MPVLSCREPAGREGQRQAAGIPQEMPLLPPLVLSMLLWTVLQGRNFSSPKMPPRNWGPTGGGVIQPWCVPVPVSQLNTSSTEPSLSFPKHLGCR